MKKKSRNYGRFYCLLKQVMPMIDREEAKVMIAQEVSSGRTDSIRELSDIEFDIALTHLERHSRESDSSIKRARSSALKQLQIYGINTTDWEAVNAFVSQPRIAGKFFYHLDADELKALTRKMRAINSKQAPKPPKGGISDETPPLGGRKNEKINYQVIYIKTNKKVYGN